MRIDVHQHLWPERLLDALARRSAPPLLRRTAEGWVLRLEGEPDQPVDLDDHDPAARAALAEADGLDRALVAPSSPLGIEALPAAEAAELVEAYNDGVAELPDRFGAWGAIGLDANTLADGLFHAGMWIVVLAGVLLVWREARSPGGAPARAVAGSALAGWGLFTLADGLVFHLLLGLHNVREAGPHLPYELTYDVLGLALIAAGAGLARRGAAAPAAQPAR